MCPNPCSTLSIIYGYPFLSDSDPSDPDGNVAYVKFYFKPTTKVRRSIIAYDEVTLIAEFGGYLGLCLGVSMMDLSQAAKWVWKIR